MIGILILGFACLVIAAVVLLLWRRRGGDRRDGVGFRECVRKPQLRAHLHGYFAAQREMVEDLARKPPSDLVEMLLDDDLAGALKRIARHPQRPGGTTPE
jgi:hypothetical protein